LNKDIVAPQLVWDLWERNTYNFPENEAIIHWDALEEPFRWTYSALYEEALKFAGQFANRGIKNKDVCAVIMKHNKLFYPIYMGISMLGAIPAVLAYPNARLHPDKFVYGLSGIACQAGLDWVVTEKNLGPVVEPLVSSARKKLNGIIFPLDFTLDSQDKKSGYGKVKNERTGTSNGERPFILQFSSGTTGLQKGVVLSHRAVLEHAKRYSEAIRITGEDKVASWLPFYHDMGLIAAFQIPLIYGIPTIQIDPFQWITAPVILFQAISQEKATLAWLPNFAYNFMAERISDEEMCDINLSTMRMFINCSEVVRAESHRKFIGRFTKFGVKKDSLSTCYAMAETTFAVTQSPPGVKAGELDLDMGEYRKKIIKFYDGNGSKKTCVSSGPPISGCTLRVNDEKDVELPEDNIGKIAIKSISLFDEYLNNPEKTTAAMKNGWYSSGDLGFCHRGEYYIIGREDDVIIVAGKNIYPEDIEDEVSKVPGVIPGRVVVFGADDPDNGTQKVCVIVETDHTDQEKKESIKLEIMKRGMSIDVTIQTIYLAPPRWLIKSSSGKISRSANKTRIPEEVSKV
jgi:acyl-CoA synthetase (AMP-forming)/AMP-acid ligase II